MEVKTVGQRRWHCVQYAGGPPPELRLDRRHYLPALTFETASGAECLASVKRHLGVVRQHICSIEAAAREWAGEVAGEDLRRLFVDTSSGKVLAPGVGSAECL